MPTFAELQELRARPAPAYPEYPELLAEGCRRAAGFADPARLSEDAATVARHGADWCAAVLGFEYPWNGIRGISCVEMAILLAAHRRGLDPPMPPRIAAWRAEGAERRAQLDSMTEAARRRDRERSDAALAACPVPAEKRPNTRGRRHRSADTGPLVHVIPLVEAVSGRARRHLAGRALCETAGRHKPRILGAPTDAPATCVSCLHYAPKIRRAAAAGASGCTSSPASATSSHR